MINRAAWESGSTGNPEQTKLVCQFNSNFCCESPSRIPCDALCLMPTYSSSALPSVAASPAPATTAPSATQNTTFRSLRSFLQFGPSKNANSSQSSAQATPSKHAFSGFATMRRSLTRERERNSSLTNLLPIISIDRSQANQPFGEGYTRRAASFSTIEVPSSPPHQARQAPNEFGSVGRHSISEAGQQVPEVEQT